MRERNNCQSILVEGAAFDCLARFTVDDGAFSSIVDALLFLVMVSAATVILLPAITGTAQLNYIGGAQDQSAVSNALLALLNGAVDYSTSNPERSTLGSDEDYEMYHRTLADLLCEHVLIKSKGNSDAHEYASALDSGLRSFFNATLGYRYDYNITAILNTSSGAVKAEFGLTPPDEDVLSDSVCAAVPCDLAMGEQSCKALITLRVWQHR